MNVVQCKVCPVCNGMKTLDMANKLPGSRQEFTCGNCRGEGIVPLVTCRGCGRPAMHWDAQIPYCGRKDCWERLTDVIDLAKVRTRNIIPLGFRPRGGIGAVVAARSDYGYWNPFNESFQDSPVYTDGKLTPEEEARFNMMCHGMCE